MSGKRSAAPAGKSSKLGRSRRRRALKSLLVLALVGTLVGVAGFVVLYQAVDVPDPNEDFKTETTMVYYAGGKQPLGRFAEQNRNSIPLSQMPKALQDAVVAAENRSFWTDEGIDPKGILRAAFSNVQGNPTQGASTITQQYVKILYLTQDQTWERKIREAILALKIENRQSKTQILEGYLNTIYFGRGAYGVQAAAQAYFNKDAKKLTLRQSAFLAAVLNDPNDLDPANGKESRQAVKGRFQFVLDSMAEMGTISEQRARKARKRLPKFPEVEQESTYGGQKGHMLMLVKDQLLELGFTEQEIEGGGLQITTTFTRKAMAAAKAGVAQARPEGFGKQLHVATASVQPGTGALRGFYGGHDYLVSELNWAIAGGQAGSTLKAFAVATALKQGFSLKSTFDGNSPYELPGDGDVENQFNRDYGSSVSIIEATAHSINTAFIDMTLSMEDGPESIIETMNAMGIPPRPEDAGPERKREGIPGATPGLNPTTGVALGSATVSPINLANGYATIAAGGVYAEPYVIEKVVDRFGEVRYDHKLDKERVLDADIAADVSYALQQVVQQGSGTDALALGRPAAGKTGTATNGAGEVSSAWFVGYTPKMSTAVMYVRGKGNEQLKGWLPTYYGSGHPADTWLAVMQRLLEGVEVEDFPPPEFVDGDPPSEGHAPYTPPPEPEPEPTESESPSQSPSPTESESPSTSPSPTESQSPSSSPSEPSETITDPEACKPEEMCPPTPEDPSPSNSPPPEGGGTNADGPGSRDPATA